jgi:hypothetical protein
MLMQSFRVKKCTHLGSETGVDILPWCQPFASYCIIFLYSFLLSLFSHLSCLR